VRVVVLDATTPGTCALLEVMAPPGVALSGAPQLTRRAIRPLRSSSAGRLAGILVHAPLVPENTDLTSQIPAELGDAHAVVFLVGYRDVIADPGGRRAAETAQRVGAWLRLAMNVAAPELLTVVVEGAEASNSNPDSRLFWTRHDAAQGLGLPPDWPSAGIVEVSSHLVLAAAEAERTGGAPTGQRERAWDAYGFTELLGRTLGPYEHDPSRWLTESALRRARTMFERAGHQLADLLAVRPVDGHVDPDQVTSPLHARQREAWLLALGLGDWLATAVPEVDAAIGELSDPRSSGRPAVPAEQ
jgi:hypothetical protein